MGDFRDDFILGQYVTDGFIYGTVVGFADDSRVTIEVDQVRHPNRGWRQAYVGGNSFTDNFGNLIEVDPYKRLWNLETKSTRKVEND